MKLFNYARVRAGFRPFGVVLALALMIGMVAGVAADSTVVVSGNTADTSMPENASTGWWFARDPNNASPYEFNDDQATIGSGSLYVFPLSATPAKKFIAENFVIQTLADPSTLSISYDWFIATSGASASQNFAYLNVYMNFPQSSPTKFYDCRFDFAPPTAPTGAWNTSSFSASTTPTAVLTRNDSPQACPATIDGMPAGSHLRMFSFNLGDTSASDAGLSGYFDRVVYSADGETTTYDFDPPPPPQPVTKDDCKKGGWMSLHDDTGTPFVNQGDCVSYVATEGKNKAGN